MSNTFNLRLSNFVDSDYPATEGVDFLINAKTLIIPLSSSWLRNVSEVTVVNKGLVYLDPSQATQLRTLVVSESSVNLVYSGGSNIRSISASGVISPVLSITGNNLKAFAIVNSPTVRSLDLTKIPALTSVVIANNASLSTVNFGLSTVNVQTTRSINIVNNNLSQTTADTFFAYISTTALALTAGSGGIFNFYDGNVTPLSTVVSFISAVGNYGSTNIVAPIYGQYIFGQLP